MGMWRTSSRPYWKVKVPVVRRRADCTGLITRRAASLLHQQIGDVFRGGVRRGVRWEWVGRRT
jgi:hypothetical protein